MLLLVLCWTCISYLILTGVDRFKVTESQLLLDPGFELQETHWPSNVSGSYKVENGQVVLSAGPTISRTISQPFEAPVPGYVRLSIDAATADLKPGTERWGGALATVVMRDSEGKRVGFLQMFRIIADTAMQSYSTEAFLPAEATDVTFVVGLYRSEGTLTFKQPAVDSLVELNTFRVLWRVLVLGWILIAVASAVYLYKRLSRVWLILSIVCIGVLLLGILGQDGIVSALYLKLQGSLPVVLQNAVNNLIGSLYGTNVLATSTVAISKVGHFAVFLLMGLVLGSLHRRVSIFFSIGALLVMALATEVLQLFTDDRSPRVTDVFIDLAGGLTGVILGCGLCSLFYLWCNARQSG